MSGVLFVEALVDSTNSLASFRGGRFVDDQAQRATFLFTGADPQPGMRDVPHQRASARKGTGEVMKFASNRRGGALAMGRSGALFLEAMVRYNEQPRVLSRRPLRG